MILGFFELFFLQGGETSKIQFPCGDQSSRSMIQTRAEPMRVFKITFSSQCFFDTFKKLIFLASRIGFWVGKFFI